MTTDNGFQPDRPPIFLSEHAEETGQPDIGKGWDVAAISSRILKTSILAAAVTAIGIGVLSVGNPVVLVANVTDWWVDKPALQLEADPSTSTIQTIADAQDAPATTDAPAREEVAAAVEPAEQNQAEAGQRQAEPVRCRPKSSARPRSRRAKLRTASPSPQSCSSNSRPGRPRKKRGRRPGSARNGPRAGGARCPARRGPRRSTGGSTPCKMHARKSARSGIIAQGSARSKMRGNRSRPWPIPARRTRPAKCAAAVVPAKPRFALRSGGNSKRRSARAPFVFRSSGSRRTIRLAPSSPP